MESDTTPSKSRDIFSSPRSAYTLFWLPATAIVVSGGSWFSSGWRTIIWPVALVTMGTACIANALRCGRVHCYLTGPFFLVMAFVTLFYGLGVLPLGGKGWDLIALTILVGGTALCCLPEMFFGKYRKRHGADGNGC